MKNPLNRQSVLCASTRVDERTIQCCWSVANEENLLYYKGKQEEGNKNEKFPSTPRF